MKRKYLFIITIITYCLLTKALFPESFINKNYLIKRDPFFNSSYYKNSFSSLNLGNNAPNSQKRLSIKLTGIIYQANEYLAILSIGDKTSSYSVNDSFYDIIIINILPEKVLLKYKNKIYNLGLGKEINL